jgi:hypothetical protein
MLYDHLVVAERKAALDVGVPKESDRRRRVKQPFDRLRGTEDVFVFVVNSAMDDRQAVERNTGPCGSFSR